jgi:hypothetical protein
MPEIYLNGRPLDGQAIEIGPAQDLPPEFYAIKEDGACLLLQPASSSSGSVTVPAARSFIDTSSVLMPNCWRSAWAPPGGRPVHGDKE